MIVNIFGAITGALASADPSGSENSGKHPTVRTRDEQIIHLLEQVDGYTWQGEIVAELPCSKSTTSRELSELESAGRITRYQIGRQNVVCLPHKEPESLGTQPDGQPGAGSLEDVPGLSPSSATN